MSLGDTRKYYQSCKQLNILPLVFRFDLKDLLFFHQVFYGISTVSFPYYLHKFAGSRLRHCHLDNHCIVSDILPKIPQNLTSSCSRHVGISKSYFYRTHILWNKLPLDLRSIESPSLFKKRLLAHQWNCIDDYIRENPDDSPA